MVNIGMVNIGVINIGMGNMGMVILDGGRAKILILALKMARHGPLRICGKQLDGSNSAGCRR